LADGKNRKTREINKLISSVIKFQATRLFGHDT